MKHSTGCPSDARSSCGSGTMKGCLFSQARLTHGQDLFLKAHHVSPSPSPGARFSKDPITYRARKAILNDLYLKKKAVYRH